MIEIKKVTDISKAQDICNEHNVAWRPDYHVIATIDGDTILQCAVFSYKENRGEIHAIDGFDGDIFFLDGLCRAILNIMDINGVKEVYLPLKYQKIANFVGFSLKNGHFYLNLDGFFKCGCHAHKEETK